MAGVAVAGVLAVASSTAATAPPRADDQDAADEAIAAFTQTVVDAGFVSDGDAAGDEADLFDVVPADGDDPADYVCTEAIRAAVADDGSLVAETARAVSDSFSYQPSGGESAGDADSISATVVAVGDDGLDELADLVAVFGSAELQSCLEDASVELIAAQAGVEDATVTVEVDDDLGVGDQSSLFRLTSGFTSGGEPAGFSSTLALARAGNHLALVTLFTTSGEEAGYDPVDALGALVESLAP